jgi:TatD DNase family protein
MIDTHAHLGMCEPDADELVAAAREAGVRRILTIGIDESSNRDAIAAAEGNEEVFACVGRHPNSADGFDDAAVDELEELAAHERVRAIGETGLDYYREGAPREAQRASFEAQIEVARRAELPLVIHMRDSVDDTFDVLASDADGVMVILHCFSAPPERVADAVGKGWHCSFAGNLTYPRSAQLREAARLVPDERLLVETDSPFLAPQPLRGRPNQPANVAETARRLAEVRDVSYQRLEETVDANAARVFGW